MCFIMTCLKLVVLVILAFLLNFSRSAKILGVVPTPAYSHQMIFQPLWKELSLKGHQLTILTPNPINDSSFSNLTEISLKFAYKILKAERPEMIRLQEKSWIQYVQRHLKTFNKIMDAELSHPDVQALLKNKDTHFDLLIVENMHPAAYAFSKRFNCPYIIMSSGTVNQYYHRLIGNPIHPILYPAREIMTVEKGMSFVERLRAVGWNILILEILPPHLLEGCNKIIEKHFGKDYLPIQDIINEVDLIFVNTHPILYPIRPIVPTLIEIGGEVTIKPSKPLDKDLQKILDGSKNGFIYFSLGSNILSKDLSKETLQTIMDTFSELPYTILWKFESLELPGKPENVVILKWLSQQDILRHPNIKLFITHGGLQSCYETIHFKVPIIGIPIFADQPTNVRRAVRLGFGLSIDLKTLRKETFKSNILEVINNPKFKNRITELSNLIKDQPMTGLEKAVWWSEYVIRHKGAKHLRSRANDLPTYQFYLLDVIGFLIFILIATAFLLIFVIKKMYKLFGMIWYTSKMKKQ